MTKHDQLGAIQRASSKPMLSCHARLCVCVLRMCVCPAVRVVGVRDWRFNQHIEDIEWLLKLSAADGSATTGVCVGGGCMVLQEGAWRWQGQNKHACFDYPAVE